MFLPSSYPCWILLFGLCFFNLIVFSFLFKSPSVTLTYSILTPNNKLRGKLSDSSSLSSLSSSSITMSSTKYGIITAARAPIPKIIYGTAWKKLKTQEYVEQAIQQGFRAIDTACQPKHYYEKGVGDALEHLYQQNLLQREDIFLQTKFTSLNGQDPNNIPYDRHAPLREQVLQSFAKSCENLRTTYLDSLVLHSPMETITDTLTVWKTFEDIYKEGKVRYLGISNTYQLRVLQTIYQQAEIKPTFLQNRFYRESNYDYDLRKFCKENNIHYQSFWTLTANPDLLRSQTVTSLARKYQKTPEQIFFGFIQSQGIIPLSGTTSLVHMKEDLEVSSTISLQPTEVEALDSQLRRIVGK